MGNKACESCNWVTQCDDTLKVKEHRAGEYEGSSILIMLKLTSIILGE